MIIIVLNLEINVPMIDASIVAGAQDKKVPNTAFDDQKDSFGRVNPLNP
jgi:hypothetical protein